MPLIGDFTGVTKTGTLTITKSTGTLIMTSSKPIWELTNEKVTYWIERIGGGNVNCATKISLKDFIYALASINGQTLQGKYSGNGYVTQIEIGNGSAIQLTDGEKIKFEFEGLLPAEHYGFTYTENNVATLSAAFFETKAMLEGERDKTFDVAEFDIAVIGNPNALNEMGISVMGGKEIRATTFELRSQLTSVMPVLGVTDTGAVKQFDENVLVLPLDEFTELRFYKDSAGVVPITLMRYSDLAPSHRTINKQFATKALR